MRICVEMGEKFINKPYGVCYCKTGHVHYIREVKIDFRYQYQDENSDRRMRRISNHPKCNSIGSREYRFRAENGSGEVGEVVNYICRIIVISSSSSLVI